jgi:anti-sigma-K factor RskA
MTDTNQRIEELFPLYALGGLNDEEHAQVDAYVASDPDAQRRLAELVELAAAVSFSATPAEPPDRAKTLLMHRVRADARARSLPAQRVSEVALPRFFAAPLLAGASLIVALAAGMWAITLNGEVARLRAETAALQRELLTQREVIAAISMPGVQAMSIAGTEHQPAAHGQLLADPQSESAVLVVGGLAPLPEGRVYQFWLIRGDLPTSAGVFDVDDRGRAVLEVESTGSLGSYDAMGVSIEPAGGSPQPTGDIVMLSSLS